MPGESTDGGGFTGISSLRMVGVGIGDDCGSEKLVAGTAVASRLFSNVTPPQRMDWGIGFAVSKTSLMSDSSHGVAIFFPWLLSGG